jgi:hypothetical protein
MGTPLLRLKLGASTGLLQDILSHFTTFHLNFQMMHPTIIITTNQHLIDWKIW